MLAEREVDAVPLAEIMESWQVHVPKPDVRHDAFAEHVAINIKNSRDKDLI
jgi:hypothetical protein